MRTLLDEQCAIAYASDAKAHKRGPALGPERPTPPRCTRATPAGTYCTLVEGHERDCMIVRDELSDCGSPGCGCAQARQLDPQENECSRCGKRRPHTIRRLNRTGRPVLCDSCHEEPIR
jgi:hypothetical protein